MGTKAPLLSQELKVAMKDLRLGQLLMTLPERILLAEKDAMPLQDFLLGLFTDEVERRRGAAASRRADHAGLDPLLGQSAVDRFRNNAYDLVIEGESYRARLKPDIAKDGPPAYGSGHQGAQAPSAPPQAKGVDTRADLRLLTEPPGSTPVYACGITRAGRRIPNLDP